MVDFQLYLVSDERVDTLPARVAAALGALPPGTAAVQLRAMSLTGRDLLEAARALRTVTAAARAPLLLNDRVDVALAAGADGVHLPTGGMLVEAVRRIAPGLLIGVSTHSLDEAKRAAEAGADFVTFGPVWSTPSKAGMGNPAGIDALADVTRQVDIPVYALGGVTIERAAECGSVGARVACIRAVLEQADPGSAARAIAGELAGGFARGARE